MNVGGPTKKKGSICQSEGGGLDKIDRPVSLSPCQSRAKRFWPPRMIPLGWGWSGDLDLFPRGDRLHSYHCKQCVCSRVC